MFILQKVIINMRLWCGHVAYNSRTPNDLQTPLPLPEFFPIANGLYLIATTNKTQLPNEICPVADPITKIQGRQ